MIERFALYVRIVRYWPNPFRPERLMEPASKKQRETSYHDMTATEFKKAFGEALEQAMRGRRIRITRHGRTGERVVVLRETDLNALEARIVAPLEALTAEFDRLVERMQSPAARAAAASVGNARPEEIAAAAAKAFEAGG